jgi:hypothetical protein
MLAIHSISQPGPFRAYFQQRTPAGKNKMPSLVAVGRNLLTTIYAVLRTGQPYDPAFHSSQLAAVAS